jgi:hypothetical protein
MIVCAMGVSQRVSKTGIGNEILNWKEGVMIDEWERRVEGRVLVQLESGQVFFLELQRIHLLHTPF